MGIKSIMPTCKNECYLCGRYISAYARHEHHIFHGTANRKISEREGLKVWLCPYCHEALHDHNEKDLELMQDAQRVWEANYIKTYPYENHAEQVAREAFRKLFGKSYIYD